MPAAALRLFLLWTTTVTPLLTAKITDGDLTRPKGIQELGECLTEKECKLYGGVKGYDCDNSRCSSVVRSESGSEEKTIYCTTYAHLAKNLCSTWLPLWNTHDESCGSTGRIIGGMDTEPGEFKHIAAVGRWYPPKNSIYWECAGTLVTPYHVLTAAHCVDKKQRSYYVRLGEHDFRIISSESIKGIKMDLPDYLHRSFEYNQTMKDTTLIKQTVGVKRVIMYPKYRPKFKYYDIALLELQSGVVLHKNVLPACLPFSNEDESIVGMTLTVAGWGVTQYNSQSPSPILKKVNVPVVDTAKCEEIHRSLTGPNQTPLIITPELICAGADNLDSCRGDSGGPLGRLVNQGIYKCGVQVLGTVSRGYQCGYMGIYSRVRSYLPWIMRYISPVHYHHHIMEQIHSTGFEFDGKSSIDFKINGNIFTNGCRIKLDFKTEKPNGTFIAIRRKDSFLTAGMQAGKVIFQESLGGVGILTMDSYNNNEWHHLDIECKRSTGKCILKITDEGFIDTWTLSSTMEVETAQTLSLGGYEGATEYYEGCLVYSANSSLQLKTVHSSYGTVTTCNTNSNRPEDTTTTASTIESSCSQITTVSSTATTIQPDTTSSTTEASSSPTTPFSTTTTTMQPVDVNSVDLAKSAKCMPEKMTVDIRPSTSRKHIYLPTCVRLWRCGGCCTSQLLECQPTAVETLSLKVLKVHRRGRRREAMAEYVLIVQENHVECSCQCKVQKMHCDPLLHNYYDSECACVCKNEADQTKCELSLLHYWDNNSCSCSYPR